MLVVLVICLIVFLVTYVVPNFAELYTSMHAQLPAPTQNPDRDRHHRPQLRAAGLRGSGRRRCSGSDIGRERRPAARRIDRFLLKIPIAGEVWLKYQVAQFSRVLGTLLIGGIPLLQALDTAADSLGTQVLKKVLQQAVQAGAGRPVAVAIPAQNQDFPGLVDRHDRSRRIHRRSAGDARQRGGVLRRRRRNADHRRAQPDRAGDHDFHGIFVAFVLISLYLPIFSLADSIRA